MALRVQKAALLERVAQAIRSGGWHVIYENNEHPLKLLAFNGSERRRLLVYIWKVTPGGPVGVRPSGEIRIQLTAVRPPFLLGDDFETLLLGYFEKEDIFVGYDVSRRPKTWGSSPSVQLRLSAVEDAKASGFGFYRRQTRSDVELAIAFRPEAMIDYILRQSELHKFAEDTDASSALERATQDAVGTGSVAIDLDSIGGDGRREAIRTVLERIGQQNFRARVLTVYGHSCGVCVTQLNLLDAAHIVPVPGGGTNETVNGMSLCKIHHAAYDCGLIGIFPDYRIAVNEAQAKRLDQTGRTGGLPQFRGNLLGRLREPNRIQDRPSADYLAQGLLLRGWQGIVALQP